MFQALRAHPKNPSDKDSNELEVTLKYWMNTDALAPHRFDVGWIGGGDKIDENRTNAACRQR